jgi:thioredoxin
MAIVACPQCGAKNRIDERAQSLQPVCGRCGTPLPSAATDAAPGKPITVTDATFAQNVLTQDGRPILLDCWAPWCGPCRMLAPTLEQLAGESNGRYIIAKLNTDENPATARQFKIDSLPTLLIFKGGQVVDRLIGLQPKQNIAARLAAHA